MGSSPDRRRTPMDSLRARRRRPEGRWRTDVRVFRLAARTGRADYRRNYTVQSWLIGWLLRCLCEVAFFGLIGVLLGSPQTAIFLVVGRGFYLGTQEVMWVIQSTAWERGSGTLPLLVSAPSRVWPVFAGRSTQWLPSCMVTSLVALLVVAPMFGARFTPGMVAGMVLAVAVGVLSSYGFGMCVAALMVRRPAWRNFASNLTHGVMALISGVFVPVDFWPAPIQWLAHGLPITHALGGLRSLLDSAPPAAWLGDLGLALAIGVCWLVLGAILLERFAEGARRDGRIDLDE